jgi:hypothetical protein
VSFKRWIVVAVLAAVVLPATMPAAGASARGCGTTGADYPDVEGGSGVRITFVRNISCRAARTVVRRCIRQRHVRGWTPALYRWDDPVARREQMARGRQLIRWQGIAGGGPRCTSE